MIADTEGDRSRDTMGMLQNAETGGRAGTDLC